MSNVECPIGKVISGFVSTEFLISQIAYELEVTNSRMDFFAEMSAANKIKNLLLDFSKLEIRNKQLYINLIKEFDALRIERNTIAHGLILTNVGDNDEYKFHNYLKKGQVVIDRSKHYNSSDLVTIEKKIIDIHNRLFSIHFENKTT